MDLNVRLPARLRTLIEAVAVAENRTPANATRFLIEKGLRALALERGGRQIHVAPTRVAECDR